MHGRSAGCSMEAGRRAGTGSKAVPVGGDYLGSGQNHPYGDCLLARQNLPALSLSVSPLAGYAEGPSAAVPCVYVPSAAVPCVYAPCANAPSVAVPSRNLPCLRNPS